MQWSGNIENTIGCRKKGIERDMNEQKGIKTKKKIQMIIKWQTIQMVHFFVILVKYQKNKENF